MYIRMFISDLVTIVQAKLNLKLRRVKIREVTLFYQLQKNTIKIFECLSIFCG